MLAKIGGRKVCKSKRCAVVANKTTVFKSDLSLVYNRAFLPVIYSKIMQRSFKERYLRRLSRCGFKVCHCVPFQRINLTGHWFKLKKKKISNTHRHHLCKMALHFLVQIITINASLQHNYIYVVAIVRMRKRHALEIESRSMKFGSLFGFNF